MSSPTSVTSSTEHSAQLAQADGAVSSQADSKKELTEKQDENEEADSQEEGKRTMGKGQPELKTEEKPEVR